MHKGLELSIMTDIGRSLDLRNTFTWSINGTYSDAKYNSDRFIGSGDKKINVIGNKLPYAPEYTLSSMLQYKLPVGIGMNFTASYVGGQFTDELNSVNSSNDGTVGLMDSYMLLDLTLLYEINQKSDFFVSVKNLSDERYIASRRPQGIKVGIPRFITAGIDYHF